MSLARSGDLVSFGVCGFLIASWMSRIPDVKEALNLSPGRLGVLLLGVSIGSLVGLPIAGRVARAFGSARTSLIGAILQVPGYLLAAIGVEVHQEHLVMIGLVFVGLGNGVWDVAQNLQGTIIEQALGRAIMPWFHAAYSGGTVLAALVGAVLVHFRVPLVWHIGCALVLGMVALWWGLGQFLDAPETPEPGLDASSTAGVARSAWLEPRTLLIGLMVTAAAFTEGSANDWMAVAFVEGHHHTKAVGVVAFAVFLVFMTAGRILGTGLLDRFGRVPVLRVLFSMAVIGCVLVVFGGPWIAFAGVAIWGLGASMGFPVGMSAAADDPLRASARISVVATIGYTAFLGGPPLIGFLGDHVGVLHALLVVGAVSILGFLLVPVAKPLQTPDADA